MRQNQKTKLWIHNMLPPTLLVIKYENYFMRSQYKNICVKKKSPPPPLYISFAARFHDHIYAESKNIIIKKNFFYRVYV